MADRPHRFGRDRGQIRIARTRLLQVDLLQVFVTDVTSKSSRVLTTGPSHHNPAVSRDGRAMVVNRDEGAHTNLWRLDPETGREQRLTEGEFDTSAALTSDGAWVLYASAQDVFKLLKIPGTGGAPVEVSQRPAYCPGVSADDRDALCLVFDPSGNPEGMLIPLTGGPPRPAPGIPADAAMARFGPDGRSITYLVSRQGADELWSLTPQGDKPRRLIRFEGKEIRDFAWSPDGTQLAVVKMSRSGDVVLLKRSQS